MAGRRKGKVLELVKCKNTSKVDAAMSTKESNEHIYQGLESDSLYQDVEYASLNNSGDNHSRKSSEELTGQESIKFKQKAADDKMIKIQCSQRVG